MTKLKLGPLPDGNPVKLTVELPAQAHRDLMAYAEVLAAESGQAIDPAKLAAPMPARFMATDRALAKAILCRSLNIRRAAGSGIAGAPDCRCGHASRQWTGPAACGVGRIASDR